MYSVDCEWQEWIPWGPCSASCLGGIQFRTRSYNPSQHGGKHCIGSTTESRICNNETCKYLIKDMVWGISVGDTTDWALDRMSKCCCDAVAGFEVS